MSVNLSARQLDDADWSPHIREALAAAGLPASALQLEITERTMMSLERSERLAEICALGVGFQIDDFGTGHTSLVTLHRLPVHALKVDRSFVATLLDGAEGEMMVRSTVALAHSLGLPVIAEGIEDAATPRAAARARVRPGPGPADLARAAPVRRSAGPPAVGRRLALRVLHAHCGPNGAAIARTVHHRQQPEEMDRGLQA